MRETRPSGSEGGARFNPSFLPLSWLVRNVRKVGTRSTGSEGARAIRNCGGRGGTHPYLAGAQRP